MGSWPRCGRSTSMGSTDLPELLRLPSALLRFWGWGAILTGSKKLLFARRTVRGLVYESHLLPQARLRSELWASRRGCVMGGC